MSLSLLGDSLLYVVLPLYAASFGIGLAWVGVLLSANRLTRVALYGAVASFGERIGPSRLTLAAAVLAAASTLTYAVGDGEYVLLAARIGWGLAFAALNLTTLAYAVTGTTRQGRSVGRSRAIISLGPVLSLSVGAWLVTIVGPRDVFAVLALFTLLGIPLALLLPRGAAATSRESRSIFPRPRRLDLLALVIGFGVDGIFVMTLALLLRDLVSTETAVIGSGLMIAARRLMEVFTAPLGGVLGDRFGANRMVLLLGTAVAAGLGIIGFDMPVTGAVIVVLAHGALLTVQPVLVAQRYPNSVMARLAIFATWRDIGAALGPLAAGLLAERMSLDLLYAILAAVTLGTVLCACLIREPAAGDGNRPGC